ncbi:MAG: HupE/UreJ family protein [Parasphingopyxis sp.]|uniref:HupE/UreJ family protein n=1 Tax=Parasphingopyxis sp. TaxID=1920299 RepID=UPI003F9F35E5
MKYLVAILVLMVAMLPTAASADEMRPGYLDFTQESEIRWRLNWKAPFGNGGTLAANPVVPAGCTMGEPVRIPSARAIVTQWPVECSAPVAGRRIGLADFEAGLVDVLVRVAPLDRPVQALRLTAAEPLVVIAERPGRWQVGGAYLLLGVEHILFGFDHLLFVLALVLLLRGGWTIAKTVTAFTIAHSITLVGVTLGFFGLPQRPVEAVIALSILFLAVEIVKRRDGEPPRLSERIPWLVAFLFGLLHGFGFAGALAEIGLPESETPMALLAFNLGVEFGQLAIVFVALGMIALADRVAHSVSRPARRLAAYAIGITASYWFIERTFA